MFNFRYFSIRLQFVRTFERPHLSIFEAFIAIQIRMQYTIELNAFAALLL